MVGKGPLENKDNIVHKTAHLLVQHGRGATHFFTNPDRDYQV